MKLKDLDKDLQKDYKIADLENMFNIYADQYGNYVFNLNNTVYLNISRANLKVFVADHKIHWPVISYKLYGTTRLAWLLLKINKVKTKDVFKPIIPSQAIFYLDELDVKNILTSIRDL